MNAINIIFDGPPSHESGRFVEVENDEGQSIGVGEWRRGDGTWALRIERPDITAKRYQELLASEKLLHALQAAGVDSWHGYEHAIDIYEHQ